MIGSPLTASIIIPAHNESSALRVIAALIPNGEKPGYEVIVVCNGCSDDTADVARGFSNVRVLEIAEASKPAALEAGDGRPDIRFGRMSMPTLS